MQKKLCSRLDNPSDIFWNHLSMPVVQNRISPLLIFSTNCLNFREPLVPLIVKSVKNPRSAVCKTALMTCADIFKAYGDLMVDSIDPLVSIAVHLKFILLTIIRSLKTSFCQLLRYQLVQLFLKASQDKRFVCEAAEAALISMTNWISPLLLLPRMQPYLKNKNPRIRAKASVCFSKSVPRLVSEISCLKILYSCSFSSPKSYYKRNIK